MPKKLILQIILFFLLYSGFGQVKTNTQFPFFKKVDKIPENILSTRSVVFVSVEDLNWQKQAEEIHEYFMQSGVDAVAYYALSDILSGRDATEAFYSDIQRREIEHMMILHQGDQGYELYVSKINPEKPLFWNGMPAYYDEASSIKEIGKAFSYSLEKARYERENFLIIDVPEIFQNTTVITKRRVEDFNPDTRIDRLAVPKFESSVVLNIDVERANQQLDSIFANHYPFEYKLVDPNLTDEEMINEGCLIVLKRLYNKGGSLKKMLEYDSPENESILISVTKGENDYIKKLSASEMQYKYYMQQLYTKDVYLGNVWDADSSWQQALMHHIRNLKYQLIKK